MAPAILLLDRAGGKPVSTQFSKGGVGPNDPFAPIRAVAFKGEDGIAAGRVELDGKTEVNAFPHAEVVILQAGGLKLTSGGTVLEIGPGRGAVIAPGTDVAIEAKPGTRWSFFTASVPAGLPAGITELAPDAPLKPSTPPPADMLEGETPQCRSTRPYEDERAGLIVGTWDSTPYQRKGRPHPVHELMHIIEGSVELTGEDGTITKLEPGDCVFVARGGHNRWDSRVKVAKFYAVQALG